MKGINLNNHISLTTSPDVKSICQPLSILGLSYFTLHRIFHDGSRSLLTTAPDWVHHYYLSHYYTSPIFTRVKTLHGFSYFLWSSLNRYPVFEAASEFDIDHGITLVFEENSYVDYYNFGANKNSSLVNDCFIMENIIFLKRFVYYFRDKAEQLIKKMSREHIIIPCNTLDFPIKNDSLQLNDIPNYELFIKLTNVKKFYLGENFSNNYLTIQELNCIELLIEGKSLKQIARYLNKSIRTIETHIANIKDKFRCSTLCELGVKIAKLGMLDFLLK